MLMAAIGDIHGNLPALQAVLAAIDATGIQTLVNTGDCIVGHPWPNEVIDLLQSRAIASVQGEMDRYAGRFLRKRDAIERKFSAREFEAIKKSHEITRSNNLEFLNRLPRCSALVLDGITVHLCHGTPLHQMESLFEDDDIERFRRLREMSRANIVVCGRTHRPFARMVEGTLFVNPGAVGISVEGPPRACYAEIDTEGAPWIAHLRAVAY